MSTFQEILDEVTWTLARPDLAARIELATVQALHKCHNLGYFARDLRTVPILEGVYSLGAFVDSPTNLIAELDVSPAPVFDSYETLAYKFRAVHKIGIFADAAMTDLQFDDFKDRAVDPVFDDFKRYFANNYQRNGTKLRINFGVTPEYVALTYFALPSPAISTWASSLDESFIVQDYPELVAANAVVALASVVGLGDLAQETRNRLIEMNDRLYTNEPTVR